MLKSKILAHKQSKRKYLRKNLGQNNESTVIPEEFEVIQAKFETYWSKVSNKVV